MPIYAYRCSACGHAQDVLQKISDPLLTVCPACGQPTFAKQVTAAGFQLKGSGWYVTDFRGGPKKEEAKKDEPATAVEGKAADAAKPAAGDKAAGGKPAADKPATAPAAAATPATPATGSGGAAAS